MNNNYVKFKGPITAILVFILLGGIYFLLNIKTGLFPDITFPKIKIIADNGEQPIDKMMATVTIPLENAIKRVEDLKILRSTTSRGSCEISAFLSWGGNIDLGKQRIEAQINEIKQTLPPDVNITIEKMNPSILPIMGFSLEGTRQDQIEVRQIAEYIIKPILARVDGISDVAVIGGKIKEYHINLDPMKMSNYRITPSYVADVLSKSNFISSNGFMVDNNRLYLNLTNAAIENKNELENTIILNSAKSQILLKHIAQIDIAEQREYVKINANGKDVPLIAIMKQPNANLIDAAIGVQNQLNEIKNVLPPGVTLKPYYNQADFVSDSISSLKDVLWIGLLLAIFVTVIFLHSIKSSSVILITIPITLGLSLIILFALNYTFNIMTIGAIAAAIGLIIDDAIVVVEQIHRTHEESPDENSYSLVIKAIKYLFPAMVGSSLSTIVIFLPFILMGGVAGAYFKVMTDTMIITLISSFFVTWIGLPVIYILLSKQKHSIKGGTKKLKQQNWVYFFINRPWISAVIVVLLIVTAYLIIPNLPSGFLPDMDEGSIVLDYSSPPGASLDATDKMLKVVDKILYSIPEIESFSRRTGTQMGFFITEPNRGDYLIQLSKKRNKTTVEISNEIRTQIESKLPALKVDFGQVITDMLGDLMASVQPIEIKIFGDDTNVLSELADSIANIISNINGIADVSNGITIAGPSINLKPKVANLAQYGLTPNDFQFQMQTKVEGTIVGNVQEKNRLVAIRLFEAPGNISYNDLKKNFIFLPNGKMKPIDEFTDINITKGAAEIDRENLKEMIAITARLNNIDLGSALKEIKNTIQQKLHIPSGYQIVYGGAYAEQQQAFKELLLILFSAVLLVFTVILFLFRNIKVSLAIIFIAVLGIAGSLMALIITGTPLNVGSYTGIVMIVGIIGENAIFTYLQFRNGKENNLRKEDAIVRAVSTRLRPNLMTALGAITALFPLALGIGTGAQMHQPLAIAIIGGFVIALPLLLIILPTILKIIEK
ncbi:MAG: acriflavine resistance protein B [Ignavibacteriales bacterium UTCHB2]|jgi:CzcA family heavy metal efflux pump|nr:MAG: Cobalt-zinc-cadmium resistance protein CzcA [Ignavibacteria bacterium ADurb.Bin266]OQY70564.1 MAG: acriflavine resistance protein B [Ignavibacteriales bacterium UTCHB2]HQI42047.1 efflux RND transporter permease subunit [Ignavibacteriaceae bacterium]